MDEGETELLLWLDIVKKLDITVVFGSHQFTVGQGERGMMTYNGKRHWVFPLAPKAFAYTDWVDILGNCEIKIRRFASAGRFWGSFGS